MHFSFSCDGRGEVHVCAQLQPQACKVQGVSFAESRKLVETIDRRINYEQKATCLVICSSVSKSTRQRSSMKRALISKCRGERFGRLCFLNASRCNWSMILFSTVACTESISMVRQTCVDVFLRRCSDVSRGHVRRVGTGRVALFEL